MKNIPSSRYPLRDAMTEWISNFANMQKGGPLTAETYALWLEEEVRKAIQHVEQGEWKPFPEYHILSAMLQCLTNYHYPRSLPLEHAEMGLLSPSESWLELLNPQILSDLNFAVQVSQKTT